jgi:hypothetical protein
MGGCVALEYAPIALWGSKPEPQQIPSPEIQPDQKRVQVDHLAAALERVVPVQQPGQQDVSPGRRRHPGDQRHGLGVAAGLALRRQMRQDGRVAVEVRVGDELGALVADLDFDAGAP